VYEVYADCKDYETLLPQVDNYVKENEKELEPYFNENTSYLLEVVPFGYKRSREDRTEIVDKFKHLPIKATLNRKTPVNHFQILEHWTGATHLKTELRMVRVLFTRFVGGSSRDIISTYDLKTRHYIGTTSMSSTLAFLVANQALVKANSYVLDPFVGTGSLLTSAAHWGAHVVGSDLDVRVLRGKDNTRPKRKIKEQYRKKEKVQRARDEMHKLNMDTNFEQYGLTSKAALDLLRIDLNQISVWRFANMTHFRGGVFDAVICDPPYGIRAGARKIGKKEELMKTVQEQFAKDHIPATELYTVEDLLVDLLEFAAKALVLGGRLVYWFPTTPDFTEDMLPTHRCFKLIANSCDPLSSKSHRRLITIEKVTEY
jgi:tRNA (guanine10-N2)-methyltransferase